jgi:hypothetical protein
MSSSRVFLLLVIWLLASELGAAPTYRLEAVPSLRPPITRNCGRPNCDVEADSDLPKQGAEALDPNILLYRILRDGELVGYYTTNSEKLNQKITIQLSRLPDPSPSTVAGIAQVVARQTKASDIIVDYSTMAGSPVILFPGAEPIPHSRKVLYKPTAFSLGTCPLPLTRLAEIK